MELLSESCLREVSGFQEHRIMDDGISEKGLCCCGHSYSSRVCVCVCVSLSTIKSESRLKHMLQRLPDYCPESMNELWNCINASLPGASKKTDGWVGLGCCELAISAECRQNCKLASSRNDITKVCKKDSEVGVLGSVCCSYAGRHTNCREYCQAIFRTDSSPSGSQINAILDYCQSVSPQLISCVGNYTKSYPIRSPVDSLYCCDRAEDSHCQSACRHILRTRTTEQEIIDELIAECDRQPLPQDPLWQCFLGNAHAPQPSHPDTSPTAKMDCAKLHCCSKANTSVCRDMCHHSSTNWGTQTLQEFDQLCEYNPVEAELVSCLADVREPCQLGCKDLSYCTNFNNRPTELFRSCNTQADQGAMNDIKLWEKGSIQMPHMSIPVRDISKCQPDMWKAVACSLQIKPCYSKSRGSVICRSDCVEILTQCGDHSRFREGQTPESICDTLSPTDDPERCIPLERYLTPSALGDITQEVIHPCNPNPCPSNQLCEVNRKGCQPGQDCLPYFCMPGCKLGEASELLVHMDSLIQVPVPSGQAGCYEVCSCGQSGRLENCADMPCVDISKTCIVGGQRQSHGSVFKVDCHLCSCFAGTPICSTRQCLSSLSSEEDRQRFTGLPCSCPDQFVPVCAQNGRTYPSACVARCMGMQDQHFSFGTCRSRDPCMPNPCPKNQRLQPACGRGGCVRPADPCLCVTAPPQDACRNRRPVCGHNGETYGTVCEAYSNRVAVDYAGPCHAVGTVSEYSGESGCDAVLCPPLSSRGCQPVTPPGQWSHQCGHDADAVSAFQLNRNRPMTLHDVLRILRLHVSVPQCDIFGYLSIDSAIVVLIVPVDYQPTSLQIEACNKEAEKIDSLINFGSPTLVSRVPLSAFVMSEVKVSAISQASHPTPGPPPIQLLLCALLALLLTLWAP
uniref:Reversion-inducing cysteine-rich protein with Kazal motifs n=1 Tax=Paramormyrops kingsleyae TaxID=1676925 RepID=A0A3B3S1T2_9TELE